MLCSASSGARTDEGTRRVRRTRAIQPASRQSSMSVRLAVPAVIAGHARLDDARAVGRRQGVLIRARMRGYVQELRRDLRLVAAPRDPGDGVADDCPQRVFVHHPVSTASMMPMMAASTAAAFLP